MKMDETFMGSDLDLGFTPDGDGWVFADPYTHVDVRAETREDVAPRAVDLKVVTGTHNLVQSLIMRLETAQGELAKLGHDDYGARFDRYVGEPNTEGNRNLIKLFVLECLRQEPRLEAILDIQLTPIEGRENRDKVKITISVKAKGVHDPLSFVIPFSFGGVLE
jgi:phage baseplate assembly protein W